MTPNEALKLAALLANKIRDRRPQVDLNVSYFKGTEGRLRFASDEFRDYFQRRFEGFSDNWCQPVGSAPAERMHFLGIRLPEQTSADSGSAATWERNDADRGLSEALLMMMIAKRSFGLVSPGPNGARITFEHPDSAAVIYDARTRERRAGMVVWQDDTKEYGELQLPHSILRVERPKVGVLNGERYVPPGIDGWAFPDDLGSAEARNPLGAVPLVEYRNQSLLDNDPISDIAGVRAMQDAINLVWAYVLNLLDYTSLPGRAILGGERLMVPILDENGQKVGERPLDLDALIRDRQIHIPSSANGQNPTIDEWSAANPKPLSEIIEQAVAHVAAQTRIPAYYLLSSSNVPATGWEVLDAGLVSKSAERIAYATAPTRELNRLAAIADGDASRAEKIARGKALWRKPQYRSEAQLMDGLQKMRDTGFPFQFIAEEYGLSPSEVDRVMQMIREEQRDPYLSQLGAKEAASAVPDAPEVG